MQIFIYLFCTYYQEIQCHSGLVSTMFVSLSSNTTFPQIDQELLTLHNHQRSSRFLVGIHVAQSSVFSIVVYTSWTCTRLAAASDKVYQLLAHDRWFFPGTPASSTTKTGHHDIAEILLKVTLNTINQSIICIMVVFSSLFRLVIDLSVPFRITTSNFTFGIFKKFLMKTEHHSVRQNYIFSIIFSKQ